MRNVLPSLHVGLQEGLVRLLSRDPRKRPTAQLLSSIKYFRYFLYSLLIPFHAIAVKCLSSAFSRRITSSVCRDCSSSRRLLSAKRYHHSIIIYFSLSGIMNHSAMLLFTLSNSSTLSTWRIPAKNLNSTEPLWKICSHASPKYLIIFSLLIYTFLNYTCIIIQKLWFQHIWPSLQQELRTQEVLAAALQPVFLMIQGMSAEEYHVHVMPTIRYTVHHFRLNLYT